jgi:hypothetical protein
MPFEDSRRPADFCTPKAKPAGVTGGLSARPEHEAIQSKSKANPQSQKRESAWFNNDLLHEFTGCGSRGPQFGLKEKPPSSPGGRLKKIAERRLTSTADFRPTPCRGR